MQSAIRCACVEWPLGNDACPGTSIGKQRGTQLRWPRALVQRLEVHRDKRAHQTCDREHLGRVRVGCGTCGHHVQEVTDEFFRLRQYLAEGVGPLFHCRPDEMVDFLLRMRQHGGVRPIHEGGDDRGRRWRTRYPARPVTACEWVGLGVDRVPRRCPGEIVQREPCIPLGRPVPIGEVLDLDGVQPPDHGIRRCCTRAFCHAR